MAARASGDLSSFCCRLSDLALSALFTTASLPSRRLKPALYDPMKRGGMSPDTKTGVTTQVYEIYIQAPGR
jgi:hypothetical protein